MTGAAHERQGLLRQTGSLAEEEAFSHKGAAAAADDMAEEWGLYGGNCFGWHLRPAVAESLQLTLFWLLVWGAKLSFATLCLLPTLLSAHTSLVTLFPLSPPVGAAPPYGTRTSRVGGYEYEMCVVASECRTPSPWSSCSDSSPSPRPTPTPNQARSTLCSMRRRSCASRYWWRCGPRHSSSSSPTPSPGTRSCSRSGAAWRVCSSMAASASRGPRGV